MATKSKSKSHTTTDHDEIRRWVEEHDGKPATVRGTGDGDEAGVLRIDFPGGAGQDRLEHSAPADRARRLEFHYRLIDELTA